MGTTSKSAAFAVVVFALALGAATAAPLVIDPDIAEATFLYQFKHNASGQQADAHDYCIGFSSAPGDERDPSPEFVARFAGHEPPVKARSGCSIDASNWNIVIDKTSGRTGLIFTISAVKCSSETSCEVEGGYFESGTSSSSNTYYLEKHDGNWVVTRDVMHWIS